MSHALFPFILIIATIHRLYFKPRKLKLSEGNGLLKVTEPVVGRVRTEPRSVGLELECFPAGAVASLRRTACLEKAREAEVSLARVHP